MKTPGWDSRISRRSCLLAGLAIPLSRAWASASLSVSFDGDNLHIAAPDLHFLSGKALDRLRNADTVSFVSQISLFSDARGTLFRVPSRERVIVSYDLWEEKFAVTIPGSARRSMSHLTASQAETWCLESFAISALGLAPDRPFWMRFDLQTMPSQKDLPRAVGETGISISGLLIEVFSGKPGPNELRWTRSGGPFQLSGLPRTSVRGTRPG